MTVMEEYKDKIAELTLKLDSVSFGECSPEILELVMEASSKIKEMVQIVESVGISNGAMADALRIMINS